MKAHGPRSSSWHPHRANNGPSTAIGAIRPSNRSIERVFCLKSHSGGWQSRAMSSMAAPAPWKPSEASRNCCMAEKTSLSQTKTGRSPSSPSAGKRASLQADATPGLSLAQLAAETNVSPNGTNLLQFCCDFIDLTNASPPKKLAVPLNKRQ